jgi:hypothetical protein
MRIIINQPAMLGDLLFIEPIVRMYAKDNEVIWPVKDQYAWLKDYMPYNIVKQSEYNMDYEDGNMRPDYIPLRFAMPLLRGTELNHLELHSSEHHDKVMLDKYRLLSLPLDMWRSLTWQRNYEKENELYSLLGLSDKPYTLVNMFFKDVYEPQSLMRAMPFENAVYMKPIAGFTMLDWSKVICNAEQIHTVETALLYIVEVLPIKAKEIHLYCRYPWDESLNGVKEFISDRWITHETYLGT